MLVVVRPEKTPTWRTYSRGFSPLRGPIPDCLGLWVLRAVVVSPGGCGTCHPLQLPVGDCKQNAHTFRTQSSQFVPNSHQTHINPHKQSQNNSTPPPPKHPQPPRTHARHTHTPDTTRRLPPLPIGRIVMAALDAPGSWRNRGGCSEGYRTFTGHRIATWPQLAQSPETRGSRASPEGGP